MKRLKSLYNRIYSRSALFCGLAGVVYSLAFFNGYLFIFSFLGLFMFALSLFEYGDGRFFVSKSGKKTFFFSLGFYMPLYWWFTVLYPFEAFSFTKAEGLFIVAAAIIGLSLLDAAIMCLSSLLWKIMPKQQMLLPFGLGCIMMTAEFIMTLGEFSLPWGIAAVSQYRFLPLLQNVSLFGYLVIPFIMSVFCAFLSFAVRKKSRMFAVSAFLALLIPMISGTVLLALPNKNTGNIKAAVIQGNTLSMERWEKDRLSGILNTYMSMTEEAASNGAELIVLPETAIPTVYSSSIDRRYSLIAKEHNCTIIVCAIVEENDNVFNSLFALYPDGSHSELYVKQHLVPFGEYLPYSEFFNKFLPFVKDIDISSNPFTSGNESNVIPLSDGNKFGSLICFDSIFAPLARRASENGANMFVVPTNDSWYEDSSGVYQHRAHSVVRAVENGKPIVRAANTGISCFISSKGNIIGETLPLEKTILYGYVYPNSNRTIYSYIGDVIMILPIIMAIAGIIIKILRLRKTKHHKPC